MLLAPAELRAELGEDVLIECVERRREIGRAARARRRRCRIACPYSVNEAACRRRRLVGVYVAARERGRRGDDLERRARRVAALRHAVEQGPRSALQGAVPGRSSSHGGVRVVARRRDQRRAPCRSRDRSRRRRRRGPVALRPLKAAACTAGSSEVTTSLPLTVPPVIEWNSRASTPERSAVRAGQVVVLRLLEPAPVRGRRRVARSRARTPGRVG